MKKYELRVYFQTKKYILLTYRYSQASLNEFSLQLLVCINYYVIMISKNMVFTDSVLCIILFANQLLH